jgi:hypothetical protein
VRVAALAVVALELAVAVDAPDVDADGDGAVDARDVEVDGDGEGDADACRDADGEVVWPVPPLALTEAGDLVGGSLATAEWLADELAEAEGDVEGEGDGDRDGEGEGEGEGEGVAEAGIAWHTVSVLVAAVFVAAAFGAACAVPTTPRARKLPLSKVTAATLTCAKRIRIACLRCSSGLPCALRVFGGD